MSTLKKILIIRTDRLGDVVLALPMLPVLQKNFPDAHLTMLVSAYTSEILRGNRYLDEVLLYDDSVELVPFSSLLRSLQARKFDAVVVVHPTPRLALLVFLARIPIRVGTGYRWYSFFFNRKVYEHRKDVKRHEAEYNLNLLTPLGGTWSHPLEFPIEIPLSSIERVEQLCRSLSIKDQDLLIIFHPGSGGSGRDWNPANFGKLAGRCIAELGAKAVLTGGKGEETVVQAAMAQIPQGAIDLTSKLSLMDLTALIQKANLFVSNSTGPLHIAAAVGTPVIGIYPAIRPCSPTRWGAYTSKKKLFVPDRNLCPRCQGRECEAADCMDQITVDQVFQAVEELVTANGVRGRPVTDVQRFSF